MTIRPRVVAAAVLAGFALSQAIAVGREAAFDYGADYRLYVERATSWLAGQGFYQAHQLAGPYAIGAGDAMYPPVALLLFVPFTVIPWPVWWAVPLVVIAAAVWKVRPSPAGWLILLAVAVWPRTWAAVLLGNPSMWALAALAAGVAWSWPAALIPLKLTLAPLALIGARDRTWWLTAGLGLGACALFGAMWFDYVASLTNARQTSEFGLGYVLGEWPVALGLLAGLTIRDLPRLQLKGEPSMTPEKGMRWS